MTDHDAERLGRPAPFDGSRMRTRTSLARTAIARVLETAGIPRDLLSHVALRERSVKAGDILLREGHVCSSLLFLEDGWACRFVTTRDGKRHAPAVIVPGDACNLEALVAEEMDCGVQVLAPGTVLSIPLRAAHDLMAHSPEMGLAISSLALAEKVISAQHTFRLGRLSARERLIHLLCELSYRTGLDMSGTSMEIPLTQEWLADLLGLTTVHVNRTLQQLRSEGLLESRSHRIVVPDVGVLRELSGFNPAYLYPLRGPLRQPADLKPA